MKNWTKKNCIFCECELSTRESAVELFDGSHSCRPCRARSRDKKHHEYKGRQEKDDKLWVPQVCRNCNKTISRKRRFVERAKICRRCHKFMQSGLREIGKYFVDKRGRVVKSTGIPTTVEMAFGESHVPRSALEPIDDGPERMLKQREEMWAEVLRHVSLIERVARRFSIPNWYDVGLETLCKCVLLFDEEQGSFKSYATRALFLAFTRAHKQRPKEEPLYERDDVAPPSESHEGLEELMSLGLSLDEIHLLEQRLIFNRTFASLADEFDMSKTEVRRVIKRIMERYA